MKTNYVTTYPAASEPEIPQPTPIPIQIVTTTPALDPFALPGVSKTPAAKCDDFYPSWLRFTSAEPRRAKTTSRSARLVQQKKTLLMRSPQSTFGSSTHVLSAWHNAVAECRDKVAAIVEECRRLNKKYRDAIFDIEATCCLTDLEGHYPASATTAGAPPWVKRVEDIYQDPVFINDDAETYDIHQRGIGDCWFLASLISVSAKKDLFRNLFVARDEKVGVYGFVFYRDGEWHHEVIDDKLYLRVGDDDNLSLIRDYDRLKKQGISINLRHKEDDLRAQLQTGGEALYFSYSNSNETWLPLIEKAYAKAHGDYYAIEGGHSGEGIEDLTGGVSVVICPEDIMDKDVFWKELMQVNHTFLFGGGSKTRTVKNIQENHAYAVLEAWQGDDGLRLLKLRNPWGEVEWDGDWSDGSKLWTSELLAKTKHTFGDDGIFWMSYTDFLKHFPAIHRTRMFNESWWYSSQQWTSVNVPWTVDYLDTKFDVTIEKKGPAVFVLTQPDDRYFQGLQGRYTYSLHFRVYSNEDTTMTGQSESTRYLVRSMHNSGNETFFTRSVSAEVEDLEPGKYSVIFKITARRWDSSTAEQNIRKYATEKKEKLLSVGRRFDYAQMKGNLRGLERANRAGKRKDKQNEEKMELKKGRKRAKKQREQSKKKKQRIEAAKVKSMEAAKSATKDSEKASEVPEDLDTSKSVEDHTESPAAVTTAQQALPDRTKTNVDTEASKASAESDGELVVVSKPAPVIEEPREEAATKQDDKGAETAGAGKENAETSSCDCTKANASKEEKADPVKNETAETAKDDKAEEFEDDDFDWDSDLDAPIYDSDTDCCSEDEGEDPFENDPWNAMCVVGLRVYSRDVPAKIEVIDESKA